MECQVNGCPNQAKYQLYKTSSEGKKWLHVCKEHEQEIGDENFKRAGGRVKQRQSQADTQRQP